MEFTITIPAVNVPHGLLPIVSTLIMGYLFVAAINMVFGPVIDQSIRFEAAEMPESMRRGLPSAHELHLPSEPRPMLPKMPAIRVPPLIDCYAPATGNLIGHVGSYSNEDIDKAIRAAKTAQSTYARTSWVQRRRILGALKQHILDNQNILVQIACLDSGKTRTDAVLGEIIATVEKLQWTIKHGENALKSKSRPTNLLTMTKRNEVRYEPRGVVAALVSWNYPLHNVLHPIVAALAAGNAIVVKPSEQTCISAQYYIEMIRRTLKLCLPGTANIRDLVQLTPCWVNEARHLIQHGDIQHIVFIGSEQVGRQVATEAGRRGIPHTIELGGKDPAIVLNNTPDSQLDRISHVLMRGVFQAAGQNCIGIERILIQPRHLDILTGKLSASVRALRVGDALEPGVADSVNVGAMISSSRFKELERLISDAVANGAKLAVGGRQACPANSPGGSYFQPTLLTNVTRDMEIARVELFAPIMLIFDRQETSDIDTLISTANSTDYDLGAYVFGDQNSVELKKVVSELRVGMVSTNDFATPYLQSLPFGGAKGSGYGRFGGVEGLRSLCREKSVDWESFNARLAAAVPRRLRYPENESKSVEGGDEKKKFRFVSGLACLGFGTWPQAIAGIKNMMYGA